MKSSDQLLLEQAYVNILTNTKDAKIKAMIAEDYRVIDELIEEGFGDYLKKAGSAIKGGVQKAASKIKETLTNGLAKTLVNAILSAVPKEELENLVNIIAKGQVPKDKIEQVKGLMVQQAGNEAPVKESYETTKEYLAATLFTESNILLALENSNTILAEARSGRELQKYAKDVAKKINELYPKNKKAMAAAIPKFTDTVSKYLGLPPQSKAPAPSPEGPAAPGSAPAAPGSAPADKSTSPRLDDRDPRWGKPGVMDKLKGAADTASDAVKGAATKVGKAVDNLGDTPPSGSGITAKILKFIKSHPKLSAAAAVVLLGVVAAAFAGSAPVVVPFIMNFVTGAGIAGTTTIVKQLISGDKVDLKKAGKSAVIGGGIGAVGGVLVQGLASLADNLIPQEFFASEHEIHNGRTVVDKAAGGKIIKGFGANYEYDVSKMDDVAGTFSTGHSGFNAHKA